MKLSKEEHVFLLNHTIYVLLISKLSNPLPKKPFTLSGSLEMLNIRKLPGQKKLSQMKKGEKNNTKNPIKPKNVNNSKTGSSQMEKTSPNKKALIKIKREFQPSPRLAQKMKVLSQRDSPTKLGHLSRSNSSKGSKVKEQTGKSEQKEEKNGNKKLMRVTSNEAMKEKEPKNIKYENKLKSKTNSEKSLISGTPKEKASHTTLNHVTTKSKLNNLKVSSLTLKKKNKHVFPKKVENLNKDSKESSNKSLSVSPNKDLLKSSSNSFSKSFNSSSNKSLSLNLSEDTEESTKKLKKNIQKKLIKQELKTLAAQKNLEYDDFLKKKKQGLIQKSIDMKQKKKEDLQQLLKEGRNGIRRINTKEIMNYESPFNTDAPSLFCENAYKISTLSPIENKINEIRSLLENQKDEITEIIKNCIENNQQVYRTLKTMLSMLIEGDECVLAKINHSESLKTEVVTELDNLINELSYH